MMPASSNVRRMVPQRRQLGAGGGIAALPIPDPRTWPSEIRTWFRNAVGEWGALDVFVFNYGSVAACYIHDAITVGALLEVTGDEWHIEGGYPAFVFDPVRIGEIQHRLGNAGYDVHVLEPAGQQKPSARRLASVVCITSRVKDRKAEK
ncbi:MAG: hypothetical protein ABSB23_18395 [Bryobacteraceae bacterium]